MISGHLGGIGDTDAKDQQGRQRDKQNAGLFFVFCQLAKGENKGCGNQAERNDGDKIGNRRRIFERMRRVCVKESSAVRREVFDGLQRGDGTQRDDLFGSFNRGYDLIGRKGLRRAKRH